MSTDERSRQPLYEGEEWWQVRYAWFQERGYKLRRRYSPDWIPSWQGKNIAKYQCEDGPSLLYANIGDAIRMSDEAFVSLKIIHKSEYPQESDIGRFFSCAPHASNHANHCVPIWDTLQDPHNSDELILVMPLLRKFDDPRFDTLGEVVEMFTQIFEGLRYMHRNHVAHRDVMGQNIMMDAKPLYPIPYHPARTDMRRDWKGRAKPLTRTQRPVKYYIIDFGLSRKYPADDPNPRDMPIPAGDRTVPEYRNLEEPINPFHADVYCMGNIVRRYFLNEAYGFEFMAPLVTDMVHDDPACRPNMDEVVARFETLRGSLSSWKLRSRVILKNDWSLLGFFRSISHWRRRITFVVRRVPVIPSPKPVSV